MTDEQKQMIEDCMNRESKMTSWEQGFIQSLSEQAERGGSISPKQAEILDTIWEQVT